MFNTPSPTMNKFGQHTALLQSLDPSIKSIDITYDDGPSKAPSQKELAFNVLGQLASKALNPQIVPKGIDTSYSGVGMGNINLGNYGGGIYGAAVPDPYSQLQGFDYVDNQYAVTKPMYQDMYSTQRQNRLLDYQTMQEAIKPNLTWAAMQAPAQQQRMFGASKGNYYDRMGMAAMADAAKWAAQPQRSFGRQGVS